MSESFPQPIFALDCEQTAVALSLSAVEVRRLISRGELLSFKQGRRRLIPVVAIEEWVSTKLAQAR